MNCACSGSHCQNRFSRSRLNCFTKKKLVGNTRLLLPAKMLRVPVSVLSLASRLYSGGSKF